MSYPLTIRPDAETDIAEGFDWYEQQRSGLGHDFLGELKFVFERIEENPFRHAEIYHSARRALVRRFPYKLFYVFEAGKAEVIAVVHARRHPQFWQRRV